jgi:putative ABC transport system substrate-binding protein
MMSAYRAELVEFAAASRLPLSADNRETVRLGALIAYMPLIQEHYALGAVYVDKILKGAKPADLPVEEPSRYELVVNSKSAHALGLSIPQSVLLRAQEVIE